MENKLCGAYYLPNDKLSKEGFKTEKEAWDYVDLYSCDDCKKEGFVSRCAAEWMVDEVDSDDS